ncbi:hypothetical protein FGB62_534g00 [Gracilaria domingensis]|nr:hypothetical protein FGB62_534g00 [Gracilaria domingensis]
MKAAEPRASNTRRKRGAATLGGEAEGGEAREQRAREPARQTVVVRSGGRERQRTRKGGSERAATLDAEEVELREAVGSSEAELAAWGERSMRQ